MNVQLNLSKQLVLGEALVRWARKTPDSEAFVFQHNRLTYSQFNERVNRFANSLLQLGFESGDKISVLSMNCTEVVECYFAIWKIGGVVVPLNFRMVGPEVQYQANQSDSKAVVFNGMFQDLITSIKSELPKVGNFICFNGKDVSGSLSYEDMISTGSSNEPGVFVDENDPAIIMYTSGTTGRPKGAVLTHKNEYVNVTSILVECDIRQRDRSLCSAPLFHAAALVHTLLILFMGGTSVLLDKFEPEEFIEVLDKEKITVGMLIPSMWIFLLQLPNIGDYNTSYLRTVPTGGAVLPAEVIKNAKKWFPNVGIYNLFGQTEMGPVTTMLSPDDALGKRGSVGKPLITVETRIVDKQDQDVPVGEVGEIVYRGPTVMKEYYNNPEGTAEAMQGGWFHSGDLVREDSEGYIYIVDRAKDMIISGGENIYAAEVEEVIFSHPGVVEAAVVGVPDSQWGESVKAVVVVRKGENVTEEGIIAHCKKNLASYKKPKTVEFTDELPRNASGKVLKYKLRENTG